MDMFAILQAALADGEFDIAIHIWPRAPLYQCGKVLAVHVVADNISRNQAETALEHIQKTNPVSR